MIDKIASELLLPILQEENARRVKEIGTDSSNQIFNNWRCIDAVYKNFLNAVEKGNLNEARKLIYAQKQFLNYFSGLLDKLYKITEIAEEREDQSKIMEILKKEDELEIMKTWGIREKRKRQINKARRMIKQYIEYCKKLEENLNVNSSESLFHYGTLVYLMNERACTACQIIDTTLDRTCRILEICKNKGEEEYSRQIRELKRKITSTAVRYLTTLNLSKNFDRVVSSNGKVFGVHGEYDHDYIGETDLTLALIQPIKFTIPLLDATDEDINKLKKKIEEVIKEYGLDKEAEASILNRVRGATDLLWNLYGLDDIDAVIIDAKQLELITNERKQIIRELFKRGKCHAIPFFQIQTFIEPKLYQITDILVRFVSENMNEPTTLKKQEEYAKDEYLRKYHSILYSIASTLSQLKSTVEDAKQGKSIRYHDLINLQKQLSENVKELLSPYGILLIVEENQPHKLIRENIRLILENIDNEIENYRRNASFSEEMENNIILMGEYVARAITRAQSLQNSGKKNEEPNYLV
ncbi:MAG: hypothetical protein QXR09_00015 [Candidatus Aenigmatarchaeota archaeon]